MCGLVATIGVWPNGFTDDELNVFEIAMYLNQLRGIDATGVAMVSKEGGVEYEKMVGPWRELYGHKKYLKLRASAIKSGQILYGHGRAATRGEHIEAHAHPFVRRKTNNKHKIVMIHNGTLTAYQPLPGFTDFKVDSEWLADKIALLGPEATFQNVNGAVACMWYDTEFKTFNAYRNIERPLFVVEQTDGTWMLNSQEGALWFMRYHHNLHFKNKGPVALETGQIYTWDMANLKEFQMTKVPDRVYPITPSKYTGGWPHHADEYGYEQSALDTKNDFFERCLKNDMLAVLDGEYDAVDFESGGRTTHHSSHTVSFTGSTPPYEPYLTKIHRKPGTIGVVQKCYKMGGTEWTSEFVKSHYVDTFLLYREPNTLAEKLVEEQKMYDEGRSLYNVPYKAGKDISFTSPHPNKPDDPKITHKAHCMKDHPANFKWYENEKDERVTLGDKIQMEVCHVIPTDIHKKDGQKIVRVLGYRLKDKPDVCMDVAFMTDKWSEEEVNQISHFEGTVCSISISLEKQYEITKSYVTIRINEMQPVNIYEDQPVAVEPVINAVVIH